MVRGMIGILTVAAICDYSGKRSIACCDVAFGIGDDLLVERVERNGENCDDGAERAEMS